MKSALLTVALATSALAGPIAQLEKRGQKCISNAEAHKFMGRFINILQHTDSDLGDYVTTAQKIIADDFLEISDSINMLANKPLGGVTADKVTYIAGAEHAPPTTGIESTSISVMGCSSIVWEWNMKGVGRATYPVKGFGVFKLRRSGVLGLKLQARELKLEFNNIAWGLDTGYGWVKQDGTLLGRAPNPPAPTTPAEPTEEEPTEEEPTEEEPTTAEPTEVEPTEAEPTEAEPTEAEPTEAEPTEAEPTEAEPTEAEPTS